MSEPFSPCWPLGPEPRILLDELAHVLGRLGAWRFLCAPMVSSRIDDYPERYEESAAGVARVLARTAWHAFLDVELRVTSYAVASGITTRRGDTSLALVGVDDRTARIDVYGIGRDGFAALGCHEVGRACLAFASDDHPFRASGGGDLPDLAHGTIAAVALGLGVLAANGAWHDHSTGREIEVSRAGGLDHRELAFLLAVQAVVRDERPDAFDTLYPTQAEEVAAWRAVLAPHAAALRDRLHLDDVLEPEPRRRPDVPRPPRVEIVGAAMSEEARTHRVRGGFAMPGSFLGMAIGAAGTALVTAFALPILGLVLVGGVAGWSIGRRVPAYYCSLCFHRLTRAMSDCAGCGRRVVGDIVEGITPSALPEPDDDLQVAE